MKRMSMRQFGRIVARVMETLPEILRPHLENLVVDIEEEPDEEMLRQLGFTEEEIAAGESLFGLFVPFDLGSGWGEESMEPSDLPNRIIIYKRPLEEEYPQTRQLRVEIRKTVIHELAHHFGYTDRDLEKFDDNPDPFHDDPD